MNYITKVQENDSVKDEKLLTEGKGPPPVANGDGILVISQEKKFSETRMGEQVIFIFMELEP